MDEAVGSTSSTATSDSVDRKRFRLQRVGHYSLGRSIGRGNFAEVRLARHELSRCKVAMKIVDRLRVDVDNLAKIDREIRILKSLQHSHIIKLYQVIRTERYLYIVTEYAGGGEMFELLMERGKMPEVEARRLFRQIVSAVSYCHANGIVHRDLKAENLLLDGNHLNVKLIDFGFSNFQSPNQLLNTWCGSPPYAAPELLIGQEYDGTKADVWSLGVVLYILVTGGFPFPGDSMDKLKRAVIHGQLKIPYWVSVGMLMLLEFMRHQWILECSDLIRKMLTFNPAKRFAIHNVMQHRWYGEADVPPVVDSTCRLNKAVLLFLQRHTGATDQQITQAIVERDFESGLFAAYSMLCDKLNAGGSSSLEMLESPSEVRRGSRGSILSGRANEAQQSPVNVIPAHHLAQLSLSTTPDYDSDDESSASEFGDDSSSTLTSSRRYRIRHPSSTGDRTEIRRHTLCSADGLGPLLPAAPLATNTAAASMLPMQMLPRIPLFMPSHMLHLPGSERRASAGEAMFGLEGYEQLMAAAQPLMAAGQPLMATGQPSMAGRPSISPTTTTTIEEEGEQYLKQYGGSKRNTVHALPGFPVAQQAAIPPISSPGRHCPYGWKQNGERRSSWTGGGLLNSNQMTQLERLYRQSIAGGSEPLGGIQKLQREFQELKATTSRTQPRNSPLTDCRTPRISITDENNRCLPATTTIPAFDIVSAFDQQAEQILFGQQRPATVIGFSSSPGSASPSLHHGKMKSTMATFAHLAGGSASPDAQKFFASAVPESNLNGNAFIAPFIFDVVAKQIKGLLESRNFVCEEKSKSMSTFNTDGRVLSLKAGDGTIVQAEISPLPDNPSQSKVSLFYLCGNLQLFHNLCTELAGQLQQR